MLPVSLDLSKLPVAVAGNGPQTLKRLAALDQAAAGRVTVYAPSPSPELREAARGRIVARLPKEDDISGFRVLFVGDFSPEEAEVLAARARARGVLVNVEDVPALCDFHMPSIVRRGDLLISVSTGGKSPALAQAIRGDLETRYGEEWADRLCVIADARAGWKAEGLALSEIARRSHALIAAKGWFA
ncbi:MAG TPA: bifunctional precorrin-2 dehydrogenase/sirohydrochlorin ferrochelatase [Micropepsaceae bacterium]|nr:bifunctional precorrin-2 dehydrogenase/sirohydrochlorin ferrochelatase [Micropepsaceae bacterium]